MLEGFGISKSGLMQQLLKNTAVVEATPYLWDQLLWDVNGKAASFEATDCVKTHNQSFSN